ncbi:hypothetical protein ACFYZ5_27635 [Streptomyces chartreusis]|uniref:hypothetical protein n=1 Tax=Streptomyces chartreusis TaxID=1969 RepID=UPI0036895DAE
MGTALTLLEEVRTRAATGAELPVDIAGATDVAEEGQRGHLHELVRVGHGGLQIMLGAPGAETLDPGRLDEGVLQRDPTQCGEHVGAGRLRKTLGTGESRGIRDRLADRIGHRLDVRLGRLAPLDLEHRDRQLLGRESALKPGVVGEHDHLPVLAELVQELREPVDLGWAHGLHGVIDDDEAERAVGGGRTGQEQGQCERVLLSLAHDAQRRSLLPVDGDVHDKLAGRWPFRCPGGSPTGD